MTQSSPLDDPLVSVPSRLYLDLERFPVKAPDEPLDDDALKDWLWKQYGDEIRDRLLVKYEPEPSEIEKYRKRLNLLDKVAQVQRQYLQSEGPKIVYGCLLEGLLDLMESEYGFIGEVKYEADGSMYLQTHATTNIAWDEATRQFYDDNADTGLKFYNMKTLFGHVLVHKESVIANDPYKDKRASGIPPGHPSLDHFLGIPFFKKGGAIIGMLGIANKPGGYSEADISFLEPFTVTCSNLIQAYWQIQKNQELIETLEQKVHERTQRLEKANERLEVANQQIMKASAAQLQHFACMSHEIRTPLNCIIGLSSMLDDASLSPMLQESMKMIVKSGDLLLAVVNDVLDYSKLESGNIQFEIERCSLQETLNAVVHSIESRATANGLSFRASYGTTVPEFVTTDSRRLQQILYNLLGNAIKFSKEDGTVELRVALEEGVDAGEAPLSMTLNESVSSTATSRCPFHRSAPSEDSGDASRCPFGRSSFTAPTTKEKKRILRFVVRDCGKGIDKQNFDRIFQPFLQANAETERLYGGTGLGLAITRKLVEGMNGKISVNSDEKSWSEFTVDFAYTDEPAKRDDYGAKMTDSSVVMICEKPEIVVTVSSILAEYGVDHEVLQSMSFLKGYSSNTHRNVLLIDEEVYDETTVVEYKERHSGTVPTLTFGPKYCVKNSDVHFRELNQVLPSVLMRTIMEVEKYPDTEGSRSGESSSDEAPPFQDLRVLIAEDNLINQKVLQRMLTRLGMTHVRMVGNGKDAVEAEAQESFDVVLMDMHMPIMNGIDACGLIQQREIARSHRHALVVFVTAHVSASFEAECAQAGSFGFLQKPCSIHDIEKCFRKVHAALSEE